MAVHLDEGKEGTFKLDQSSQLRKEVRPQETILNTKKMFLQSDELIKKKNIKNKK